MPIPRFQFRVRTLLLAMTASIVVSVGLLDAARRAELQRDAVARLRPHVRYAYELSIPDSHWIPPRDTWKIQPPASTWPRRMLGNDFFDPVVLVHLSGRVTPSMLEDYRHLQGVRILRIGYTDLTDREFLQLFEGRRLEELKLGSRIVSDQAAFQAIDASPGLVRLSVSYRRSMEPLTQRIRRLRNLQYLELRSCRLPQRLDMSMQPGLKRLALRYCEFPSGAPFELLLSGQVASVEVNGTSCNDQWLRTTRFDGVKVLDLSGTPITDQGIGATEVTHQLAAINVANSAITARGILQLVESASQLHALTLDTRHVTQETVTALTRLPSLELVQVRARTGEQDRTAVARDALRARLPHIQIF